MTPEERETLRTWWHPHYLAAAELAYPDECAGHELAVGWKITRVDGITYGGYYWPLVNGDHDLPVLHEADAWLSSNEGSCPYREGDGFCLVTNSAQHASSGGIPLSHATGHVLVYPVDLARSDTDGKFRVPWCVDVDSFDPLPLIIRGFFADLAGADLSRAYLSGANLFEAYLSEADLAGADLSRAYLSRANLFGANLSRADLSGAKISSSTLFPASFDADKAGVIFK